MDKTTLSAGAGGGGLAAAIYIVYELMMGGASIQQENINDLETELGTLETQVSELQEKVTQLEQQHADRCEVDASYFRGRAAAKRDDAATARNVAQRYRVLRGYLAQQDPPETLSPVDQNRMQEKDDEADDYEEQAKAFDESARVVCQISAPVI